MRFAGPFSYDPCINRHNFRGLFKAYVRPILEYNSVIWSSSLRKDVAAIEKVQWRFTKRLHGLKDLSYAERLQCLNISSLELRRLHLD